MDMTMGEMMLYGGIAAFAILLVILIILLNSFKRSRKRLAQKIEDEFDNE